MSRNNTPPAPPPSDYATWVAKYRADGRRERELHLASLERRRAMGLLEIGEPRYSADNAAADEAEAAIDADDNERGGDDSFAWGYAEL